MISCYKCSHASNLKNTKLNQKLGKRTENGKSFCRKNTNIENATIMTLHFFINNQGQSSSLKVAYTFKVFGAQSCLMVAQQFDQVTNVCEKYNQKYNFQDSKLICISNDFKISLKMLLKQLSFGVLSASQLFYDYYKGRTSLFFNLQFLLLFSETGLSAESYLAICHPRPSCL